MDYIVKDIPDSRGISDIGAALFIKRGGESKYHLWLPLTNIPATGSAPNSLDTTVTTARRNTHIPGRIDPGDRSCKFLAHRDNFEILRKDHRKKLDFLQVNPDGVGYKFQGIVTSFQDEISVGANMTGTATITVTDSDELPITNVVDLIQETVIFTSAVDAVVSLSTEEGNNTMDINIDTDPVESTVTSEMDTTGVCTATIESGILKIEATQKGSCVIKLTAKKEDCADGITHILVVVN